MDGCIDIGTEITLNAVFRDLSSGNALYDPDGVILRVRDPAGTETTYTYGTDAIPVRDSIGKFHADMQPQLSGAWWYRFEATGNGATAREGSFSVNYSNVLKR